MNRKLFVLSLAIVLFILGAASVGASIWRQSPGSQPQPEDPKSAPLSPTATCHGDELAELERFVDYVHGRTWTARDVAWSAITDTDKCAYLMQTDELNEEEKARLRRAGGEHFELEEKPPARRLPGGVKPSPERNYVEP